MSKLVSGLVLMGIIVALGMFVAGLGGSAARLLSGDLKAIGGAVLVSWVTFGWIAIDQARKIERLQKRLYFLEHPEDRLDP